MESNKIEINIPYHKKLYDASVEQSVDTDFTLPDYYPEIVKVLKCLTEINILSAQCSDLGINIGGQVVLTLLYFGSDDQPNSFTHTVPFTKLIDLDGVGNGNVNVVPRLNYLNTKAIGPRKIEAHGSMALGITVDGILDCSVLSSAEIDGIYTKSSELSFAKFLPIISKSLFVEDEILIPQNKPTVGKILRKCAKASVSECKYTSGKAVVKGELEIELLYCPADGSRAVLLNERSSFSQIIDCPADCDDVLFDAVAQVDSLDLHPKTSLDGEVRNISFEARVSINISPYCTTKMQLVTDAFSGCYQAEIVKSSLSVENLAERINENFVCQKSIDFGQDTLSDILDLWCNTTVDFVTTDNTDILIKGTAIINILGCDSDGKALFFERSVEYEYRYNIGEQSEEIRCRPDVSVQAVQYSIGADGIVQVSVELCIKCTVFFKQSTTVITKISIDEKSLISKRNDSAVILYFAENESVWDIAGKYQTSPDIICKINGIEGFDEKCNRVLLIPNIQ